MTFVHLDVGNEEHDGIAEFFGVTKVFEAMSSYLIFVYFGTPPHYLGL